MLLQFFLSLCDCFYVKLNLQVKRSFASESISFGDCLDLGL